MGGFISAPTNLASPSAIGSTTPNTGAFTTLSATPPANTTALASSGYSVTGSGSTNLVNITGTWNTTGTPRAINVDITNTASNFDARLIDLRVGGASRFYVQVGGPARFSSGVLECPNGVVCDAGSFNVAGFINGFVSCTNTTGIRWASGTNWQASHDLFLVRDGAAGTLAQRNSTNAQTFRIYNTFTDASNYERGFMRWATNVLEIGAEAAGTGTQRQLRFPLGTVTASTPLSITQTWNSAGVTFTGFQLNATDTASASASLLMDLQVGGTSRFKVDKNGSAYVRQGSYNNCGLVFGSSLDTGIYYGSNFFSFDVGGAVGAMAGSSGFLAPGGYYGLSAGGASSPDLILTRDAADILAQRRTTNAQAFKLYRTFTDASNYERLGFLATNTTRYTITSENAGTGSARSLEVSFYTAASDPTSTDITSGCFSVWKNSGTGIVKLWANDGGTMKSVALI